MFFLFYHRYFCFLYENIVMDMDNPETWILRGNRKFFHVLGRPVSRSLILSKAMSKAVLDVHFSWNSVSQNMICSWLAQCFIKSSNKRWQQIFLCKDLQHYTSTLWIWMWMHVVYACNSVHQFKMWFWSYSSIGTVKNSVTLLRGGRGWPIDYVRWQRGRIGKPKDYIEWYRGEGRSQGRSTLA